jgi:hypothetical protein
VVVEIVAVTVTTSRWNDRENSLPILPHGAMNRRPIFVEIDAGAKNCE